MPAKLPDATWPCSGLEFVVDWRLAGNGLSALLGVHIAGSSAMAVMSSRWRDRHHGKKHVPLDRTWQTMVRGSCSQWSGRRLPRPRGSARTSCQGATELVLPGAQPWGRCRVDCPAARRAFYPAVSRPVRVKKRRLRVLVVTTHLEDRYSAAPSNRSSGPSLWAMTVDGLLLQRQPLAGKRPENPLGDLLLSPTPYLSVDVTMHPCSLQHWQQLGDRPPVISLDFSAVFTCPSV